MATFDPLANIAGMRACVLTSDSLTVTLVLYALGMLAAPYTLKSKPKNVVLLKSLFNSHHIAKYNHCIILQFLIVFFF